MAILQFSTCGREATAVPTSIHCDHLISAYEGAEADLKVSRNLLLERLYRKVFADFRG